MGNILAEHSHSVGGIFIDLFDEKVKEIVAAAKGSPNEGDIEWLFQGTIYPDVIESCSFKVCSLYGSGDRTTDDPSFPRDRVIP